MAKLLRVFYGWAKINKIRKKEAISVIFENDGLSLADWCDWFRHYDLSKPMAIINFTKFRY